MLNQYDYYYSLKGHSLYEHLESLGVEMTMVNGHWFDSSGKFSYEELVTIMEQYNPWPAEKNKKWKEIQEAFKEATDQLVAGSTETERNSWALQETEARLYKQNNSTPTPALSVLANSRGVPLATLVDKVIEKADLYKQYYFYFQGKRDALEDKLKSFPDHGEYEKLKDLRSLKYEV